MCCSFSLDVAFGMMIVGFDVLVLPKNYGFGLRYPEDNIWGFWSPDEKTQQVWSISQKLLSMYGLGLDIVYDDPAFPVAGKYQQVYYWNQTVNFD